MEQARSVPLLCPLCLRTDGSGTPGGDDEGMAVSAIASETRAAMWAALHALEDHALGLRWTADRHGEGAGKHMLEQADDADFHAAVLRRMLNAFQHGRP